MGFHMDAVAYGVSGADTTFSAGFGAGNVGMSFGQASLYNTGAGAEYNVDQDFLTPLILVAPNSSVYWSVTMSGTVVADSSPNVQYLAGLPYGYVHCCPAIS
jgi:hypothetical protein